MEGIGLGKGRRQGGNSDGGKEWGKGGGREVNGKEKNRGSS